MIYSYEKRDSSSKKEKGNSLIQQENREKEDRMRRWIFHEKTCERKKSSMEAHVNDGGTGAPRGITEVAIEPDTLPARREGQFFLAVRIIMRKMIS